jgi:hypothetical protein
MLGYLLFSRAEVTAAVLKKASIAKRSLAGDDPTKKPVDNQEQPEAGLGPDKPYHVIGDDDNVVGAEVYAAGSVCWSQEEDQRVAKQVEC